MSTLPLTKYTAIFSSSTGPAMAHVMSSEIHSRAWSAIGRRYSGRGRLIGLIPGHHPVVLQGATMTLRPEGAEVIPPQPSDDGPGPACGLGSLRI